VNGRTQSGLWVPAAYSFRENRNTKRTTTLRSGERALITVDDSGTVMQILRSRRMEADEKQDAIVRPKTIRYRIRAMR
jgi:hypothetical protein